jgi:uncharacterized membrane protein SpoIIM required for sporulation
MKVAELLEKRRQNWRELEQLCDQLRERRMSRMPPQLVVRFATLYRSACADLALADAHHLPGHMVQYLHRLVGRAHNQLYRSQRFNVSSWAHAIFVQVPQRIFHDGCVQLAFVLFWGLFLLAALLAYWEAAWPDFAEQMLTAEALDRLRSDFSQEITGRDPQLNALMAGFYIRHNTSIGLQCFASGLLVIPGLVITMFNAAHLGACFGYMARPDVTEGANFFHFVTAHGPFELTAIVLSAAAGLRLGTAWIYTRGYSRGASLRRSTAEAMPLMGSAMLLFFMAALIEGFLSPSAAPYAVKIAVALLSSALLMFYFVVLGLPRRVPRATG